jgi:Protein of unknown function (DUF1572)
MGTTAGIDVKFLVEGRNESVELAYHSDMAADTFRQAYLHDIARAFRNYKALGDRAMAQVSDENLHAVVDPDANSIAIIVKHVGGNLRSRFTDFLTTDGEKPTRNRDDEFEMPVQASRAEVLEWWESGWAATLGAIDALTVDDLDRTIPIRGEAFLVVEALSRSITHTAYHVGQIVMMAKHLAGPHWASLSIPKGRSKELVAGRYKEGILPQGR